MKCPHCLVAFHDKEEEKYLGQDCEGPWGISTVKCPTCDRMIVFFGRAIMLRSHQGGIYMQGFESKVLVRPRASMRPPAPPEVPTELSLDYHEACLVLADSPQASAALSRRCLQSLLRDHAGVKKADLSKEIQEVIDSGKLPSFVTEALDAIRNVGNFAAHPIKSSATGEIHKVEPGEAEWTLEVLETLFDFYFVQPAILKRRRAALDAKLSDAGKPPMKG